MSQNSPIEYEETDIDRMDESVWTDFDNTLAFLKFRSETASKKFFCLFLNGFRECVWMMCVCVCCDYAFRVVVVIKKNKKRCLCDIRDIFL